jgi:very-short-patch-repair endonuclease
MRAAFGLVSVLVAIGVVVMIMHTYTLPAAKKAVNTKKAVEQRFGSNTREGLEEAKASITLDDVLKGNRFDALQVTAVVPGGQMASDFGFMTGDVIVAINGLKLRDLNDADIARDQVFEAKMRDQPITVLRNNVPVDLRAPH